MTFSTRNEGFQVSFPNGYTISIGTGSMHYCDNHTLGGPMVDKSWESKDCELAIIRYADSDSREYVLADQIEGYVTPMQFARVIEYVSSLPEDYASKDISRTLEDILWKTVAPRPDRDSPPSPELIESLDFWVGEDDGDDPVFPNSYPCDEDWDAPAKP